MYTSADLAFPATNLALLRTWWLQNLAKMAEDSPYPRWALMMPSEKKSGEWAPSDKLASLVAVVRPVSRLAH